MKLLIRVGLVRLSVQLRGGRQRPPGRLLPFTGSQINRAPPGARRAAISVWDRLRYGPLLARCAKQAGRQPRARAHARTHQPWKLDWKDCKARCDRGWPIVKC